MRRHRRLSAETSPPIARTSASRPAILLRMDYEIRHMTPAERPLLERFLYEAIYVPEGFEGEIPHSVIHDDPRCRAAFEGFGSRPDDRALVAVVAGEVVGACWVRTTDEYGHIDDETPSFSISLYKPYRGMGIGLSVCQSILWAHHSRLCAEIEAFKAVSDEIGEFVDTLSSVLSVQDCLQLASSIYDLPIGLLKSMIPDTKEN